MYLLWVFRQCKNQKPEVSQVSECLVILVDAQLFLVFQAADLQSQLTLEGEAVFYFFLLLLFY